MRLTWQGSSRGTICTYTDPNGAVVLNLRSNPNGGYLVEAPGVLFQFRKQSDAIAKIEACREEIEGGPPALPSTFDVMTSHLLSMPDNVMDAVEIIEGEKAIVSAAIKALFNAPSAEVKGAKVESGFLIEGFPLLSSIGCSYVQNAEKKTFCAFVTREYIQSHGLQGYIGTAWSPHWRVLRSREMPNGSVTAYGTTEKEPQREAPSDDALYARLGDEYAAFLRKIERAQT